MLIGILKTDDVLPELAVHHGEYPDMFSRILGHADPKLTFRTFDAREEGLPSSDAADAWLITGSRLSVYDDLPWIERLGGFVKKLHAERRKLVGICFGHQLVAQVLGGRVEPAAIGWTVGVQDLDLEDELPWDLGAARRLRLLHSHRDQVTLLPSEATNIGGNARCPFSMYRIGDHILCVQGHAEFSAAYARDLYGVRRALLGDDLCDEALRSVDGGTDSEEVARWVAAFFRYSDDAAPAAVPQSE